MQGGNFSCLLLLKQENKIFRLAALVIYVSIRSLDIQSCSTDLALLLSGTSMRGIEGTQTDTSCLIDANTDVQLVGLQMCGNGIVEQGEDCDPGTGTNSTCCDSTTCRFINGAICDPLSSQCCTEQCTFAPSTQVCRPSKDAACDQAETCTGNSSACPADQTAPNGSWAISSYVLLYLLDLGQSCGNDGLACASGICTSVSRQFKYHVCSIII